MDPSNANAPNHATLAPPITNTIPLPVADQQGSQEFGYQGERGKAFPVNADKPELSGGQIGNLSSQPSPADPSRTKAVRRESVPRPVRKDTAGTDTSGSHLVRAGTTLTTRNADGPPKSGTLNTIRYWLSGNSEPLEQRRLQKELETKLSADPAPFRFKAGQLCSLVDPENVDELKAMGGLDGLMKGLGTDGENGLTDDESSSKTRTESSSSPSIRDRERVYGRNVLPERKSKSLLTLMWLALQDRILILLIVAAIVSLALGLYTDLGPNGPEKVACAHPPPGQDRCDPPKVDWVEGLAILVAVVIVDLVGSLNDWQKERQFRSLDAKKEQRDVTVLRNGAKHQVDVHDVLVGDIVFFEPGEVVAFDGVVLDGHNIKCDESSVTGESDMINKLPYKEYIRDLESSSGPLKHKSCFMISGSKVLEGVGRFVVTAVGPMSFNGKLMMSLRDEPENTPLQRKLNNMAELIAKLGTTAGLVLFIALMIRFFVKLGLDMNDSTPKITAEQGSRYGQRFISVLIISVTIIVVAVPEGLPLAVTLALAFATRRMSNQNLLVRILGSCETMANATCVCTDKTGTLTQNKMNVVAGCIGDKLEFQDRVKFEVQNAQASDSLIDMDHITQSISEPLRKLLTDSICINSTAFIPDRRDPVEAEERPAPKPWYVKLLSRDKPTAQAAELKSDDTKFIGSKTETALLGMVVKQQWGNYAAIRKEAEIVQVIPFGSKRKAMGAVIKTSDGYRFLVKGASEVLLSHSTQVVASNASSTESKIDTRPIDDTLHDQLSSLITNYASQSLRTISLCYRDFASWPPSGGTRNEEGEVDYDFLAQDLTLLAVTAIEDPLRPGVADAVRDCRSAGVQVKMCTGDNMITAKSIAAQCGMFTPGGVVIEGPAFRRLDDHDLTELVPRLQVLARSSPEDKKRLIDKLKSLGEIVAVTGDGTNDGPALKSANVGFSMGLAGSEVAKEASDIILLDDNFSSIVSAIMWGRCVNDAVRKFLQFQFTVNIVAVIVTFVSAVASDSEDSVLTAVQLLWLNLIMDTFAALALATDPADPDSLKRKPDRWTAPLVTTEMWMQIFVQTVYQTVLILVLNFSGKSILHMNHQDPLSQRNDELELGALIFNVFVWCQLFNQVNARRLDRHWNIFHNIHRNVWFLLILGIEVGAQILIIFVGGATFSVTRLSGRDWAISIVAGFISWPLGFATRLCPSKPIERFLIKLKLLPDPEALPTTAPEAEVEEKKAHSETYYTDWNEPAVGRLAQQLGAFSSIRGGRLRASNLVLKGNKRMMRDQGIHPKSLLAIVPAFIGASVGGGWKPNNVEAQDSANDSEKVTVVSVQTLYHEGKLQFHKDTSRDDPYLQKLEGA
ncbi:P-type Ca(2+) transporter [Malassezia psittaci]|uniref:Calcium-transporting ATPase n=1 Tax=Malassezia psittaci TaxID=1821823 RepID=A0AAF0F9F9_9BASI|nr:P-type Ca(2+) transporter [Malassezia psittaci]